MSLMFSLCVVTGTLSLRLSTSSRSVPLSEAGVSPGWVSQD